MNFFSPRWCPCHTTLESSGLTGNRPSIPTSKYDPLSSVLMEESDDRGSGSRVEDLTPIVILSSKGKGDDGRGLVTES